MSSNKGFSLIEVLIASLVLFFTIITLNVAFKQYATYRQKQQQYEDIYIALLSLKDKLEDMNLSRIRETHGTINTLPYKISIREITRRRNFVYGEIPETSGNMGTFQIILYEITIQIDSRVFSFYETQYHKETLARG